STPFEHRATAPGSIGCWVLTVSDTKTPETDTSGQLIRKLLTDAGHRVVGASIERDEPKDVQRVIREACAHDEVRAVLVTGGTGITSRDSTYEAIEALLDKRLPGFGELVVLLALVALASGCSGPSTAAGPGSWREGVVTSVPPELARINDLLADLAERLQPGLVYVRVQRATPPRDEPAREEPGEPRRSTGSGFVIDSSGLIVTNAHVVE